MRQKALLIAVILLCIFPIGSQAEMIAPSALHPENLTAIQEVQDLFNRKQYQEASIKLMPLAEQGEPLAQLMLGMIYGEPGSARVDHAKSFKFLLMAAEQGQPDAIPMVAVSYEEGRGVEKNISKAKQWHEKGVELGNAFSEANLGYYLLQEKDYRRARLLLLKAANQMNGMGINTLGTVYTEGLGVDQDLVEAYKWFKIAATRLPADDEGAQLAKNNLEALKPYMSKEQIAEGETIAKNWKPGESQ